MTRQPYEYPREFSQTENNGKGLYLYCGSLRGLVKIPLQKTVNIPGDSRPRKITYKPVDQNMAPIAPFHVFMSKWHNYHDTDLNPHDFLIDKSKIPFGNYDVLPGIVVDQYRAWKRVIMTIGDMLIDRDKWSKEIDTMYGCDALLMFQNLLVAPGGFEIDHLTRQESTKFARLGPCALIREIRDATITSKVCAYYEFPPFNELKDVLKDYKKLLYQTDRSNLLYKSKVVDRMPILTREVDALWSAAQALETALNSMEESDSYDPDIEALALLKQKKNAEKDKAKEKAHCHAYFIHWVNARMEEDADINCPPTPMETWVPPRPIKPAKDDSVDSESCSREQIIGQLAWQIQEQVLAAIQSRYSTKWKSAANSVVDEAEAHRTDLESSDSSHPSVPSSRASSPVGSDQEEAGPSSRPAMPRKPRPRSATLVQAERPSVSELTARRPKFTENFDTDKFDQPVRRAPRPARPDFAARRERFGLILDKDDFDFGSDFSLAAPPDDDELDSDFDVTLAAGAPPSDEDSGSETETESKHARSGRQSRLGHYTGLQILGVKAEDDDDD